MNDLKEIFWAEFGVIVLTGCLILERYNNSESFLMAIIIFMPIRLLMLKSERFK